MIDYRKLVELFQSRYKCAPRVFKSPGSIILAGDHLNNYDGFVLPVAVDKEMGMVIGINNSETFRLYSLDRDQSVEFTYSTKEDTGESWALHFFSVIEQLKKENYNITGVDVLFCGNIPLGAGMGSSAALECATVYALDTIFELGISHKKMIGIVQKAANESLNKRWNLAGHFAGIFSKEEQALKLDCLDLSFEALSMNLNNFQLVLVDSKIRTALPSTEMEVRRAECAEGFRVIKNAYPEINTIRDADLEKLRESKMRLKAKEYLRCKYVIEEMQRVEKACRALKNYDVKGLGQLLYSTHEGLQRDFEISCPEIDFLVDYTRSIDQVLGAKMIGEGFGGLTLNIVQEGYLNTFIGEIKKAYKKEFDVEPEAYPVKTAPGTSEITKFLLD